MTIVWNSILTRFKATTENLQTHDLTIDNAECILVFLCGIAEGY